MAPQGPTVGVGGWHAWGALSFWGAGAGEEGVPACVPLKGMLGTHQVVLVRDLLSSPSFTSSLSPCFFICLSLLPFPF